MIDRLVNVEVSTIPYIVADPFSFRRMPRKTIDEDLLSPKMGSSPDSSEEDEAIQAYGALREKQQREGATGGSKEGFWPTAPKDPQVIHISDSSGDSFTLGGNNRRPFYYPPADDHLDESSDIDELDLDQLETYNIRCTLTLLPRAQSWLITSQAFSRTIAPLKESKLLAGGKGIRLASPHRAASNVFEVTTSMPFCAIMMIWRRKR